MTPHHYAFAIILFQENVAIIGYFISILIVKSKLATLDNLVASIVAKLVIMVGIGGSKAQQAVELLLSPLCNAAGKEGGAALQGIGCPFGSAPRFLLFGKFLRGFFTLVDDEIVTLFFFFFT